MKTKVMTITPAYANRLSERTAKLIEDGKMRQRTISDSTVDQYARAMKSGKWILHHQGIGIAEDGGVIDGQHRLYAIAKAGVPVDMMVTTGIPATAYRNGYTIATIDGVDRIRARGLGTQLQISHGIKNANNLAALCKALAVICSKDTSLKLSVTDCLAIMHVYQSEIEIVTTIDPSWRKNTVVTATLVMGVHAGEAGLEFASQFLQSDHLKSEPASVLARWCKSSKHKQGGSVISLISSATAYCLKAKFEGRKIDKCMCNPSAIQWLVDLQGKNAAKIRSLFIQPEKDLFS